MLVVVLHILGYDLWFYASHRLAHWNPWLWSYHKRHHEKRRPVWTDTYHGHWLEGPAQSLGFLLPWALGLWSPWESLVAAGFCQLRGLLRHDARSTWLIGNHHLLHHWLGTSNYGEAWIDDLCGTTDTHPELREAGWVRI